MQKLHYAVHSICYNLAWLAAILIAAMNCEFIAVGVVFATLVVQVFWQVYVMKRTQGMLLMVGLFFVTGTFGDSLLYHLGLISFSAHNFLLLSPMWMMSLWISFSLTFYATLQILYDKYLILALLAFFLLPFAYAIGAMLGAAEFPYGYWSSFAVGAIWAVLFPLNMKIYNSIEG
jgi:hypothetical protein